MCNEGSGYILSRKRSVFKKILVFLLTVADFVNKSAADIHCQVKKKCQEVLACSAVIVQSSDVTDIVQFAVFTRIVSEV